MPNYDKSGWGNQRLFNFIAKHLITQNAKAIRTDNKQCVCYENINENRCAVGCLLPISYYRRYGDQCVSSVKVEINVYNKNELLNELQECHDSVKVSRWPQRLRRIAKDFGLEIPEFLRKSK